jgi:hypothetical protein
MEHTPPWISDVVRGVASRTPTLVELVDLASRWLAVAAILTQSRSTWLIVPDRDLQAVLRALAEHLPDVEVSTLTDSPQRLTVVSESSFFEQVGMRWLTHVTDPLPNAMVVLEGDGFVERARDALTRTVRDRRLAAEVRRRVRVGRLLGSTAVLPVDLVRELQARGGLPIVNDDPNWVAFLEQELGGTALKSRPIDVGPLLRHTFDERSVVVLSRALAVGGSMRFAADELGLDAPLEVFEDPSGWQDLTLFTPPMPETSSMGWPYAVAEAAWEAIRSREGRALVFGSTMNREAIRRRIRRPLRAMGEAGAGVTFASVQDLDRLGTYPLVVVDRLPFPSTLRPVESALRHRHVRWFESRALPKAVQTLRRMASVIEPGGALVVLDHRVRSRSYGERFTDALSGVHITDWEGFLPTLGDDFVGGA